MKVALIHDWLVSYGGAERCLEVFLELFPQADVFTCVHDSSKLPERLKNIRIKTSFIQKLPFSTSGYMYYLPLMPMAVEAFDMSGYDLVISISHAVAKGVKKAPGSLHICYCLTPMRYAWDMQYDYSGYAGFGPLKQAVFDLMMKRFRNWDSVSSKRVDEFISISQFIRQRVENCYGRPSEVIYPPVETSIFVPSGRPSDFFLVVSRLVPQKRVDIIVEAFNALELPLKIIGEGREENRLKKLANSNIEFLGCLDDSDVAGYLAGCRALVFASLEDFGITPLEAQAAGRPVIAFGRGGALETVVDGKTGIFFGEQTAESVAGAVKRFNSMGITSSVCRANAEKYSREVFKKRMASYIDAKIRERGIYLEK